MMRILIVKMSSLGDIIHAFSVVQYIKQHYPQTEIDWVVEEPYAELVRAHPLVHQILPIETKKWRSHWLKWKTWQEVSSFRKKLRHTLYHIVLDLQGNVKSGLVTASVKSSLKVGFGYATLPEWPNLFATHRRFNPPPGKNIRDDYLFLAQSALDIYHTPSEEGIKLNLYSEEKNQVSELIQHYQSLPGLKVMVCPGSNWSNKQLSIETLKNFLSCFTKHIDAHFLFLWGHQEEKNMADELATSLPSQSSIIHKLSLPALQNLMAHVDLILAMDSLPLHLAGTTSTPTYSVFGASLANKYKPKGERHGVFQGTCPFNMNFEKRCALLRTCKTGDCVKQIEGDQLYQHFSLWWSSLNSRIVENKNE